MCLRAHCVLKLWAFGPARLLSSQSHAPDTNPVFFTSSPSLTVCFTPSLPVATSWHTMTPGILLSQLLDLCILRNLGIIGQISSKRCPCLTYSYSSCTSESGRQDPELAGSLGLDSCYKKSPLPPEPSGMLCFSTSPRAPSSPMRWGKVEQQGIVTIFYMRPMAQKGDPSVVTELISGVATLEAVCSMFLTLWSSITSCRPVVEQGK